MPLRARTRWIDARRHILLLYESALTVRVIKGFFCFFVGCVISQQMTRLHISPFKKTQSRLLRSNQTSGVGLFFFSRVVQSVSSTFV